MNILDDLTRIRKLDTGQVLTSIDLLPDQCKQALEDVERVEIPKEYSSMSSIVFCGMGGSAYGGRIIKSLYQDQIKIPVDIVSDYHLPNYVNDKTLVIAASYSGDTEETISAVRQALKRKAMIIGIGKGGKLSQILVSYGFPMYTFSGKYNPSDQPRHGQGYMQIGQIAILAKLGIINIGNDSLEKLVTDLKILKSKFGIDVVTQQNLAKQLANSLKDKIVNLIGAEFLEGAIHAIRNPFNETGKHFANYFIVPELNHHLLEGLTFPNIMKDSFAFLLIASDLYSEKIKKRLEITRAVIEKNSLPVYTIDLALSSKLGQVFELICVGSYLTFYLAIVHGVDPVKIPWVDYFKNKMSAKG